MAEQSISEMKKPALLSIAIPVHNGGRDFERCLETIARETNVDFHAYIFENASTDGTRALAEAFAARDDRFSVRPSDRLLPVLENFRRAIREVGRASKYFCIRAADDHTSENFFEVLVDALELNKDAHLAVPRILTTNKDGTIQEMQFEASEVLLEKMIKNHIKVPGSWYYGVYRSGQATDFLIDSIKVFPYAWGVSRLSVFRVVIDLGAVADSRAIFYCQQGSSSDSLYKPKTVREAIWRRILYYRALTKMRSFQNPNIRDSLLFNKKNAWRIAGQDSGTTKKNMKKLPLLFVK